MKIDKRDMPVFTSLVVSFIVLAVLYSVRETAFSEQAVLWILRVSFASVAVLLLYWFVARFLPKLSEPISVSAIPTAVIIYFGFLVVSLSYYKDLLREMSWDPSMVALGIALVAFGWGFFTQRKQLLQTKETLETLRASVSDVGEKVVALDEKFSKFENVIDKVLEKFQKVDERLNKLEEKDKSEDKN